MEAPADFLLIDIGNTSVKMRLAGQRSLHGKTVRLSTSELNPPALIRALGDWRYRRIILSSVAPAAAEVVRHTLPEEVLRVNARLDIGLDLSLYPQKRTLGADRLVNVVAALDRHGPGPLVAADFGTAATFDVLDAAGRFVGGVIAPGADMLANAMHRQTAALPQITLREPREAIGRNTKDAMLAGAVIGWRGAMWAILKEIGIKKVIVTGGNVSLVAPSLPEGAVVDRDLTFHGLRLIGARHFGDKRRR